MTLTSPADARHMSTTPDHPPRPAPPPAPPPARFPVLGCAFALSFVFNLIAVVLLLFACMGLLLRGTSLPEDGPGLSEKFLTGSRTASDRVAVVRLETWIMEGFLSSVHKQIEQAASDSNVKAVVLRVNSPGGTITASDDLYLRLQKLRDGDPDEDRPAKPLVASFGSIAASGGYYAAVGAQSIFAEPTTSTASIGVYASFPNAHKFADEKGVTFITIKAGEIKDAGGMFKPMTDREKLVIQDQIDDAYVRFLDVVQKGRPKLTRAVMLERFRVTPLNPDPKARKPAEPYERYRADGGTFTGPKAKDLGLVDSIGRLEDAVKEAAKLAGISEYRGVEYQKPKTLSDLLVGVRAPVAPLEAARLALTPRLWYLEPTHEAAARLAGAGE
jgi:protease-4